jgi:hypothetical protein
MDRASTITMARFFVRQTFRPALVAILLTVFLLEIVHGFGVTPVKRQEAVPTAEPLAAISNCHFHDTSVYEFLTWQDPRLFTALLSAATHARETDCFSPDSVWQEPPSTSSKQPRRPRLISRLPSRDAIPMVLIRTTTAFHVIRDAGLTIRTQILLNAGK